MIQLIKSKAILAKEFHIQPSEIDIMPMWEYEYFIRFINEAVKEENDRQQSEMSKYNVNDYKKMTNSSNMNKMAQTPKMPSMPSMPKL